MGQVDYAALAEQARRMAPPAVDYAALAEQARQGTTASPQPSGDLLLQNIKNMAGAVGDVAVGAGKKLMETGVRGGALLRKIPGVNAVANALPSVDVNITPTNTSQRVGGMVEQAAEVAAPARALYAGGLKAAALAAPKLAPYVGEAVARMLPRAAVEGAGSAGLALAQGATPGQAVTAGALGAGAPTIGEAAVAIADKLKAGAAHNVADFFNPTTRAMKAKVGKQTDEILNRGSDVLGTLGSNRQDALETFAAARHQAGDAVDEALKTFGSDAVKDAPARLTAALEAAKAPYVKVREVTAGEAAGPMKQYVTGLSPAGRPIATIPLNSAKVTQLDGLKQIVAAHGDQMTVNDLVGLRKAWDEIAYAKPGYGEIGPSQSAKWAKKLGGDAIRTIIGADTPDLQAVNREFSFWKDLETVMSATIERKRGQVGGLLPSMAEGAGRVASAAATGSIGQAVLVGKLAKTAQQVFASPRYASLAANVKSNLADAIMSGSVGSTQSALRQAAIRVGAIETPMVLSAETP